MQSCTAVIGGIAFNISTIATYMRCRAAISPARASVAVIGPAHILTGISDDARTTAGAANKAAAPQIKPRRVTLGSRGLAGIGAPFAIGCY